MRDRGESAPVLSDEVLRALLAEDPGRGWRAFVDQYTSTLLALIARAGVADEDDAADVYLRVCERLAEDECARLRRHDPRRGALAAWLTILVRHVVVDLDPLARGTAAAFSREAATRRRRLALLDSWARRRSGRHVPRPRHPDALPGRASGHRTRRGDPRHFAAAARANRNSRSACPLAGRPTGPL